MTERLPQRFRYQDIRGNRWMFGWCIPRPQGNWSAETFGGGFGSFTTDPWEILGHIIGDVAEFQWIDNDHGWPGDVMVRTEWNPINPADPSTLPGEDDADERGEVWIRLSNGYARSAYWEDFEHSLATITHWAPRIKQVPPVWEESST